MQVLFDEVDTANSGEVSVDEMTRFVWGKSDLGERKRASPEGHRFFDAIVSAAGAYYKNVMIFLLNPLK